MLMEIGRVEDLTQHVDKTNFERIITYLEQVYHSFITRFLSTRVLRFPASALPTDSAEPSYTNMHPSVHGCRAPTQVASYVPEPEDAHVLGVCVASLRKLGKHPEALLIAVPPPALPITRGAPVVMQRLTLKTTPPSDR